MVVVLPTPVGPTSALLQHVGLADPDLAGEEVQGLAPRLFDILDIAHALAKAACQFGVDTERHQLTEQLL